MTAVYSKCIGGDIAYILATMHDVRVTPKVRRAIRSAVRWYYIDTDRARSFVPIDERRAALEVEKDALALAGEGGHEWQARFGIEYGTLEEREARNAEALRELEKGNAGAPSKNEPLYNFLRAMWECGHAWQRKRSIIDQSDDTPTYAYGGDFLEAMRDVLACLGVRMSDASLYSNIGKALK